MSCAGSRASGLVLAGLVALLVAAAPAPAPAAPRDFFGVMADGPLLEPGIDLAVEATTMRATGVGSARLAVYWRELQPSADRPVDWSVADRQVAALTRGGVRVLPVLLRAPVWATGGDERLGAVPDRAAYARFCAEAVRRYGRGGTFWRERPDVPARPIRAWQIWNEPDLKLYWAARPWPRTYVGLLRAAHRAIKRVDRRAVVVAAGLTNRSWVGLDRLYRAGGRGAFDAAAIHPFSRRVGNVLKIVRLARRTMRRHRDGRRPLFLTEVTWSSGKGRSGRSYGWEETEAGQAAKLRAALPRLAAARRSLRIAAVFWFTWLSPETEGGNSFGFSGLRKLAPDGSVVAKPAQAAYRDAVRRSRRR